MPFFFLISQVPSPNEMPRSSLNSQLGHLQNILLALASVAQWIEYQPENQGVACLIPSPGRMPGFLAGSLVWGTREGTTY